MACPMCGGTGRIVIPLPDGRELETYCLECLDREAEDFEEEDEEGVFVPWEVLDLI
ncbi:hypothetical protein [Thermus thermophilus]|uniref:Uncharacterized protein n=1 Tax=Thermus thermophilus TaxID=274 RepID=A0A7R7TGG0_THETH|nr:hypothetical protein [Thermus thermophilus]BCP67654.1 hypothetical protein TthHB5018_c25880 [Thermus thermophilus]